ncbi:hypothetical protein BJ138DRAFT_1110230 [Hygrophoropsis aurantiaca]|uniref:Uncharacterized protein n=1 Tax=Hygrophoropsis aurantiaca TaxID=72124 RepID=A0ACB8ANL4_9AGAM|nr:hypothetical protein BJ138DRAFT_1110230 [Hygrophoropsis aurantiaca]
MKLVSLAVFTASFVAHALSQSIEIAAPADWSSVYPGNSVSVQVDLPNFNSQATQVAVVIAIFPCFSDPPLSCPAFERDGVGNILYNGPFDPQYPAPNPNSEPPQQIFDIAIPPGTKTGPAVFSVTHISFVGADNLPFFESTNITVVVQ